TVEPVDGQGRPMRAGERGVLSQAPGAPGAFLAHWNTPVAARSRLPSGWLMTGQLGSRDLDGYLWPEPLALEDGIIVMDGLRVSLDEVQAALAWHPKVAAAAVLELDPGEIKAFVVPAPGLTGDVQLARELQAFVANRRAGHEVPRRVEFVDALPTNQDGAVAREQLVSRPIRLDGPSITDRPVLSQR
ncbi:MAG: acyl-CoA synthetase, partial [Rhodospirillaceae bacterium]|nr:acyl-CoA synthetase [Rhodospirillales bacterium]